MAGRPKYDAEAYIIKALFIPAKQVFLLLPFLVVGAVGASFFAFLPGQTEISIAFNIGMAIPAFYGLCVGIGRQKGIGALVALSAFAFGIESVGVATGFPYTAFAYGGSLGPKVLGLVPATLPFAWVPVVIGSRVLADSVISGQPALRFFLSVFLMVAFDLVLDPGAVSLGYWTWASPGAFYGIPELNFAGWILSSVVGQAILWRFVPAKVVLPWFAGYTYFWSLFFWVMVAVLAGRIALACIGGAWIALWIHGRSCLWALSADGAATSLPDRRRSRPDRQS